ncbi:MAG TPA: hypothetical protein VHZ27_03455, partial [Solirubrobacteraceae bacterium]|nr:hypothetical protein [Solirubrobacteraceae bacterium]
AHLHLSWLDPHKERRFTVVGSRRMATFDDMALEGKLSIFDKGFDQDSRGYGEYITGRVASCRRRFRMSNHCGSNASISSSVSARAAGRARTVRVVCAWSGCSRSFSSRSMRRHDDPRVPSTP